MVGKRLQLFSIILLLILITACFQSKPLSALEEKGVTVEVEGISPILNGDKLQAEQMALLDASRKAVEQVIGTMVSSETDVKDFQFIQDTIKTRANGYVSRQEILNSWEDNGYYKVWARLTVKRADIQQSVDDLRLTLLKAGKPRLMILVPNPDAAAKLMESLKDAGFPVVDPQRASQFQRAGNGTKVFTEDPKALSKLAASSQAEILIIGDIRKEPIGETQGIHAERAYLTIRALRADGGAALVSQTFNARGVDLSVDIAFQKALNDATDQAAGFLKEQLPKQFIDNQRSVQITVNNISYSDLQQLQRRLKATPNVDNVFLRNFNNGSAALDVETGLLTDQLADFISGWKELHLDITSISGSKIILQHQ